jgi:hypothetical protein
MFAMADAISRLGRVIVPATPKTTYSASVTGGGTSINKLLIIVVSRAGEVCSSGIDNNFLWNGPIIEPCARCDDFVVGCHGW